MTSRPFNFSAGPSILPTSVLHEVQAELVDYDHTGLSLLEVSHRGQTVEPVIEQTREMALKLWDAPDDFDLLFFQGGATMQFPLVAMNLLGGHAQGAYINSGHWAQVAMVAAGHMGQIYSAWSGEDEGLIRTPQANEIKLKDNTRY